MSLTGKTGYSPTVGNALVTLTLGNSDYIKVLILSENRVDGNLLLEKRLGKGNLGGGISSSVDLDLHDVSLLDTKVELPDLSVGNNTHNGAELRDTVKLVLDVLSSVSLVLLGVLGVGLLLALVPVLVATTLELLGKMLGEDSGESPQSTRGLNVSHNSNNNHRRGLKNGNGINNLLLVHEGTRAVNSTDNVGHTGLVPTECSKVRGSRRILILGEGAHTSLMTLGTLLGEESKISVTGGFELTVRPITSSWSCRKVKKRYDSVSLIQFKNL